MRSREIMGIAATVWLLACSNHTVLLRINKRPLYTLSYASCVAL